jgi:hypothetical protein
MQELTPIKIQDLKTLTNKRQKTKDKRTKAFVNNSSKTTKAIKCDLAIEDFGDLIDPKYNNWFCRCYYALGDDLVRKIASEARQEANKSARNLFGSSLKKEMIKRGL